MGRTEENIRRLEREYNYSDNEELLFEINRVRRRADLPPHDDSRLMAANSKLVELIPIFSRLVADFIRHDLDLAMYLWGLNDDPDAEQLDNNALQQRVRSVIDDISLWENELLCIHSESSALSEGSPSDFEYIRLLKRYGLRPIEIGPEVEDAGDFTIFSQGKRKGYFDRKLQQIMMRRAVCERSVHIFRKLLIYGTVNLQEMNVIPAEWDESVLSRIDDFLDQIEVANQEIGNVSMGYSPSTEAREMFSDSWYGQD